MSLRKRQWDSTEMDYYRCKMNASKLFIPTPQQFLESCLPQEFSLPMPIMKHIWENPASPEVYQKLIKCCKFFFIKNPILVIENLQHHHFKNGWDCNSSKCYGMYCQHKKVDMDKLKAKKIWISKSLVFENYCKKNTVSSLISMIDQCNIKQLKIEYQHLSYNELKFLAVGVKECHLGNNILKYDDGEDVLLEDIIKLFSGSKSFYINFGLSSTNTFCKNYDNLIDACQTIEQIDFTLISRDFDVPAFYQSLKRSKNRALITIYSWGNIRLLSSIVNEILSTESFEFVPPVVSYSGLHKATIKKMKEIQENEAAKYR